MAIGDITSVTIRSTGWDADVVIEGFTTGATYAYGLGSNNDPSSAKVVFTVTSLGYDAAGNATTIVRTIYGVKTVRKVYPSEASLDETGGGNLTFRMALSDCVYQKDNTGAGNSGTAVTVTIASGLVVNSGGGSESSAATTNLACTNNSTLSYPKVVGHFAVEQRRALNGSAAIEVFLAHKYGQNKKPVAYVSFTATGATSGHVESGSATEMILSARGDNIPVYAVTLNLSTAAGFTRGELVNIKFVASPWVGDSSARLDSNADAGTQIFQIGDLKWTIMDKMICVVDPATGNDTTGVASETQATADASPVATIQGAMTKIAAQNNTSYSLNRIDGGEVQLKAGTYSWVGGGSQASTNGYFTICPHSSTNRAGVIFDNFSSSRAQKTYQRFYNVTFTRTTNVTIIFASNTNVLVMEAVNFADARGLVWYSGATNSNVEFLDCISNSGWFAVGNNDGHSRLIRNYSYTATTEPGTASPPCGNASCILGFHSTASGSKGIWKALTSAGTNNFIIGYSRAYALTDGLAYANAGLDLTNAAIVANVIERTGAAATPLNEISDANVSNLLIAHNTFAGQRFNHENDITAAYVNKTFTDYMGRFNSFNARGDHRADIRDTDASMIGTWSVGYSAGWQDNHNEAIAYSGDTDFWGIRSNGTSTSITPSVAAGYTSDKSRGGADTGNGDYTPAAGSVLLNRLPSGAAMYPYDAVGTAFRNDGTDAIGAINTLVVGGAITRPRRQSRNKTLLRM